jgi:putative SOS response-associated peptidase YedK
MCGRFVRTASLDEIVEAFDAVGGEPLGESYNVAPTTDVYTIRHDETERVVETRSWGLIPFWAKDARRASNAINARAETLTEKPTFRHLVSKHRCIMPLSGYYEWDTEHAVEGVPKQPYLVRSRRDGDSDWSSMLAAASLWSTWVDPADSGRTIHSVAMVTTEAQGELATIHHRMPVLLTRDEAEEWLDPSRGLPTWISAQRPEPEIVLAAVSKRVNSVRNNDRSLIQPLPEIVNDQLF